MSDSQLVSSPRGGASQPAGGGLRSQIDLRSTTNRGMSKLEDETLEGVVGYSLLHWIELSIPSFRRDWSLACAGLRFKMRCRFCGGIILSNVSLMAFEPKLIRRRHNREKFNLPLVEDNWVGSRSKRRNQQNYLFIVLLTVKKNLSEIVLLLKSKHRPYRPQKMVNPVSPNSDHRQFSPNNIHMLPREMVMRVNKMITKEKMLWSVIKLSQLIL